MVAMRPVAEVGNKLLVGIEQDHSSFDHGKACLKRCKVVNLETAAVEGVLSVDENAPWVKQSHGDLTIDCWQVAATVRPSEDETV